MNLKNALPFSFKRHCLHSFLLAFSLLAFSASVFGQSSAPQRKIVVSKQQLRLYVIESRDTLCNFPCAAGSNLGDKTKAGDRKTPEGTFLVAQIQDSHTWRHDFHDGHGSRAGAYGGWFIRLKVPGASGIGIHGTCFPESIGTRSTEGCIRLRDEDLDQLIKYVTVGMECVIEKDN